MNFDDIVRQRRSVRDFSPEKIPRELVYPIIEAARLAPSASNVQPWRFIYVDDDEKLGRIKNEGLGGIVPNRWIKNCPAVIVLCAKMDLVTNIIGARIKDLPYFLIDCGIAGEHLVLKATELGLGTCWIGWFAEKKLRLILDVPAKIKIVSLIALGYPIDSKTPPVPKKRLPLDEILFFNSFKG